jgi:hypothetical protein
MRKNVAKLIALGLSAAFLISCTSRFVQISPLEKELLEKRRFVSVKTADGNLRTVRKPRLADGRLTGLSDAGEPVSIEAASIRSITATIEKADWIIAVLYGGFVAVEVALAVGASSAPSPPPVPGIASCPFLYSFDGAREMAPP